MSFKRTCWEKSWNLLSNWIVCSERLAYTSEWMLVDKSRAGLIMVGSLSCWGYYEGAQVVKTEVLTIQRVSSSALTFVNICDVLSFKILFFRWPTVLLTSMSIGKKTSLADMSRTQSVMAPRGPCINGGVSAIGMAQWYDVADQELRKTWVKQCWDQCTGSQWVPLPWPCALARATDVRALDRSTNAQNIFRGQIWYCIMEDWNPEDFFKHSTSILRLDPDVYP